MGEFEPHAVFSLCEIHERRRRSMKFNPEVARLHLQQIAKDLSHKPKHAGRVARIEAVLALHGWPFTEQRFREFCRELRIIRRVYVVR